MNWITFILLDIWDNFTVNPLRTMFTEYFDLFGAWTFGIFFGLTGAIIYTHTRSIPAVIIFLLFTGAVGTALFPAYIGVFMGLILAFMIGAILYKAFIPKRREF